MSAEALCRAFLDGLPEEGRGTWADLPGLGQALAELHASARSRHPDIELDAGAFAAFLAARYPREQPPDLSFSGLNTADLFLTCACLAGSPAALLRFQRDYLGQVHRMSAHLRLSGAQVEELIDDVRRRLLSPTEAGALKLAEYRGTGALMEWVKITVVRAGQNLKRKKEHSARSGDDELIIRLIGGDSPEVAALKAEVREELRSALRGALGRLDPAQRNLLRFCMIDGLSLHRIAEIWKVSAATVSRRLAAARDVLGEDMKQVLRERMGIEVAELPGLLDLVRSQLDLSLSQVFRKSRPGA